MLCAEPAAGGEPFAVILADDLTGAIAPQLERGPVTAYRFEGRRYGCGSKLGFLQASLKYGLKRPDLGAELREILEGL